MERRELSRSRRSPSGGGIKRNSRPGLNGRLGLNAEGRSGREGGGRLVLLSDSLNSGCSDGGLDLIWLYNSRRIVLVVVLVLHCLVLTKDS